MNYKTIVTGGRVQRFHSDYMIQRQDVAQHSFQCALLAHNIVEFHNEHASQEYLLDAHRLVMHMLLHDIPEQHVGDCPGYIKSSSPELAKIFQDMEEEFSRKNFSRLEHEYFTTMEGMELAIIKFVDLYDCAMTSLHQCKIGNKDGMDSIAKNCAEGFYKVIGRINDGIPNIQDEYRLQGLFALLSVLQYHAQQFEIESQGVL